MRCKQQQSETRPAGRVSHFRESRVSEESGFEKEGSIPTGIPDAG